MYYVITDKLTNKTKQTIKTD